jgi:hypothetical protein
MGAIAHLAVAVERIRIGLKRPFNQQFGVRPQFATMSHDKATGTHRRRGRQTPNLSLGGPWKKFEPLSEPEPFFSLAFPLEP